MENELFKRQAERFTWQSRRKNVEGSVRKEKGRPLTQSATLSVRWDASGPSCQEELTALSNL